MQTTGRRLVQRGHSTPQTAASGAKQECSGRDELERDRYSVLQRPKI